MPATAPPLAVCYGTRPQTIKASVLIEVLGARWPLLTVDTGQHYAYELNALLYEQLGVRRPEVCLDVGSGSHAAQTAALLTGAAQLFEARRPWAVLVVGDTNSTLGCALAAAKLRIPVVHVEAGLRARDLMMAEEINRRVVDQISTVLCAPSAAAEARLLAEQVAGVVVRTGDVAHDVLLRHAPQAPPASVVLDDALLDGGAPAVADGFVFATLHRAELVDDAVKLRAAVRALGQLELPVIVGVHPRTREALRHAGADFRVPPHVHLCPPFGYLETLALVRDARVVVTDSGGVQREAYWLGTPCVTVRGETEWKETVELGANRLVAPVHAAERLAAAAHAQAHRSAAERRWDRTAYGDGTAAALVRDAVERIA